MKQHEAVIQVMEENGGFATLGHLNRNALLVEGCDWKTKTPFASIRRIVQDERFFFKIRPGLWALKKYKAKLPPEILPAKNELKEKREEYSHSYYQGLIVELGNLKKFKTFVPNQDKNKLYLGKKLYEITTIPDIVKFSYDRIVQKAKTVDVIWFNEREMPVNFFEIEHSTDMQNSLLKFVELQDFYAGFCIVADEVRKKDFLAKKSFNAFQSINNRVKFWNYDDVAELHTKTSEYATIESKF
ncbi:MAG: hypothetical protein QUS13_06480 [Smithella sp.]|nr:hypothetical protein [Smithella sp.]